MSHYIGHEPNFSLQHRVQNGSEARPASYPMGIRGSFPGSSAKVKNAWKYTSTPQYTFMAWCLVKHRTALPSAFTFTHKV
jgi:hypothetical protein